MKSLVLVALLLLGDAAWALNYHLEPDKSCTSTGNTFELKCERAAEEYKILVYSSGQRWFKKHTWENPRSKAKWELFVVKNNEDILVLSERVQFSGSRLLSIFKKTGKYYQTEVAYASFGNEMSVTYGDVYKTSD